MPGQTNYGFAGHWLFYAVLSEITQALELSTIGFTDNQWFAAGIKIAFEIVQKLI